MTAWHKPLLYAGFGVALGLALSLIGLQAVRGFTSISHGYQADEKLAVGTIVSLKENTSDQVEAAATKQADNIFGVVINEAGSLLTLSNGKDNQVQVATSGVVPVLVSDINGDIEKGDHITASPVKGLGMRATSNAKVVGIAQGKPNYKTAEPQVYKGENGQEHKLRLGEVPVLVNVAYYFKEPEKTLIPAALQNVANSFAGKEVSTTPILISAAIFIITLVIVASIIYSMIKNSIISVGRNPMAQSAVFRDVLQLSSLVVGILSVSLISIYLILTRF